MSRWQQIYDSWSASWKDLHQRTLNTYRAAIQADPKRFAFQATSFVTNLEQTRASLERMRGQVNALAGVDATAHGEAVARYVTLSNRYHQLAAGFYTDTRPAGDAVQGVFVPILVVGGLVVGVAAIAWAIAAYAYCSSLREHTALQDRELAARVEASKQGRTLQPSTVQPLPSPSGSLFDAGKGGALLVGGLAVVAGALTVPVLLKKARP